MYEKKVLIRNENERISGMFRILQDIAGEASEQVGLGGDELAEKGLMWVIVRYDVEFLRMPDSGEMLTMQTWAGPFRHCMSQRNYLAFDAEGDCVLRGAGIWTVVDYSTRNMVDPGERGILIAGEHTGEEPPRPLSPQKLPLQKQTEYAVTDQVLDRNLHMNNTRYFDVAQDCIGDQTKGLRLSRVQAVFSSEARAGDVLDISWGNGQNNWFFQGEKHHEPCFRIGLKYA